MGLTKYEGNKLRTTQNSMLTLSSIRRVKQQQTNKKYKNFTLISQNQEYLKFD